MTISWTRDAWSRWNDAYSHRVSADLEARSRGGYPGRSWTSAQRAPRAARPEIDRQIHTLSDGRETRQFGPGSWITTSPGKLSRPQGRGRSGAGPESASAASASPRPRLSSAERARRSAAARARHAARQAVTRNAAVDAVLRGYLDAPGGLKF